MLLQISQRIFIKQSQNQFNFHLWNFMICYLLDG